MDLARFHSLIERVRKETIGEPKWVNDKGAFEYENIEAHALDEAIDRALALLRLQPSHKAIEIWEGPNRLYPARRRRPGRSRISMPA